MKRLVPLLPLIVAGLIGLGVGTAVSIPRYAAVKARIIALESILTTSGGWTEDKLTELEKKAASLEDHSERILADVEQLTDYLTQKEKKLGIKTVWANQDTAEPGDTVLLFGTVSSIKTSNNHLFVRAGNWQVVCWGWGDDEPQAKAGYGVAAVGKVKIYNGTLEVVADKDTIWFAGPGD